MGLPSLAGAHRRRRALPLPTIFEPELMDRSSQPSPNRLSQLTLGGLAGMICFLSYLVVALKDDKQRLLADADISTRAFIRGTPVAKLPVTTSTGETATLDQFCGEGRSLAIFFTAAGCAECSRLDPLLNAVSRKREVTVVAVYGTSIQPRPS